MKPLTSYQGSSKAQGNPPCCVDSLSLPMSLAPVFGLRGLSQVPWEACELSWSLNPMEGYCCRLKGNGSGSEPVRGKEEAIVLPSSLLCQKESGFPVVCDAHFCTVSPVECPRRHKHLCTLFDSASLVFVCVPVPRVSYTLAHCHRMSVAWFGTFAHATVSRVVNVRFFLRAQHVDACTNGESSWRAQHG